MHAKRLDFSENIIQNKRNSSQNNNVQVLCSKEIIVYLTVEISCM